MAGGEVVAAPPTKSENKKTEQDFQLLPSLFTSKASIAGYSVETNS
jgi:hypothetical protein